jgi:hypothetical protein
VSANGKETHGWFTKLKTKLSSRTITLASFAGSPAAGPDKIMISNVRFFESLSEMAFACRAVWAPVGQHFEV